MPDRLSAPSGSPSIEPRRPLRDVRVLELDGGLRSALVGRLLADLGADVIRLRNRAEDDVHLAIDTATASLLRAALDQGKRVVGPGEAQERDEADLEVRLRGADVLVCSELSEEVDTDMLARYPGLIRCVLSAHGRSGPLGSTLGSDITAQAAGGLLDTTGSPDGPPTRPGVHIADHAGALAAALSVVAALRARRTHGGGTAIDVAGLDTVVFYLTAFLSQSLAGLPTTRIGNRHTASAPWNTYPTRDGEVVLCTINDPQWVAVLGMIGRADLGTDPRFATVSRRRAAVEQVDTLVAAWTRDRSTAEVIEQGDAWRVPVGEVRDVATLVAAAGRGELPGVRHGQLGGRRVALPTSPLATCCTIPLEDPLEEPVDHGVWGAREQPTDGRAPEGPPLAGIRVIELSSFTSGPVCGRILASLGADVIKVEPPGGERTRTWEPLVAGESYFFRLNNVGKRSLTLDLKHPEARQICEDLVRSADVVLSNFGPGVMDRLGFSAASVRRLNPSIVNGQISGFARSGALAARRALDTVVQAESGIMDTTGWPDRPPDKVGISLADLLGANLAALAVVAALEERDRTGEGQTVDISMFDAALWLTELWWPGMWTRDRTAPRTRVGHRHPLWIGNGVYACARGDIAVGVETGPQLRRLVEVIDPHIVLDGLTPGSRRDCVDEALRGWAQCKSSEDAVKTLTEAQVPAAAVASAAEVADVAHLWARGALTEVSVDGRPVVATGSPVRLGGIPLPAPRFTGAAGCDTHAILTGVLGLSPERIATLLARGVIGGRDAKREAVVRGKPGGSGGGTGDG